MEPLHEAQFYDKLAGGEVLCTLCPHDCRIREGGRGVCGVHYVHECKLYTYVAPWVEALGIVMAL